MNNFIVIELTIKRQGNFVQELKKLISIKIETKKNNWIKTEIQLIENKTNSK